MKKRGIAPQIILLIVIVALVILGLVVTSIFKDDDKTPIGCTEDARLCDDGSSVGRNPDLNCEFDPCPEVEFWKLDDISLGQNDINGNYFCFGCNDELCVDPIKETTFLEETLNKYCDSDFEVVENAPKNQCIVDEECEFYYTDYSENNPCGGCSYADDSYICLNSEEAEIERQKDIAKFGEKHFESLCAPCPSPDFDSYICECSNNECEKTENDSIKLRICPDELIDDQMPCACVDDSCGNCDSDTKYYIFGGTRRELIDFDVDWINEFCDLEELIVY